MRGKKNTKYQQVTSLTDASLQMAACTIRTYPVVKYMIDYCARNIVIQLIQQNKVPTLNVLLFVKCKKVKCLKKLARLFTAAVWSNTGRYRGLNNTVRINRCTTATMRSSASAVAKDADRM